MINEDNLKSSKDLFKIQIFNKPKEGPKTERRELIGKFLEALNEARTGQTYTDRKGVEKPLKPLSAGFIASKMAKSKVSSIEDLKDFYKNCKKAKNFSAYWWWSLDAKNAKKN